MVRDESVQAAADAQHLHVLDEAILRFSKAPLRVNIPALPYDVHDLPSLDEVSRRLGDG